MKSKIHPQDPVHTVNLGVYLFFILLRKKNGENKWEKKKKVQLLRAPDHETFCLSNCSSSNQDTLRHTFCVSVLVQPNAKTSLSLVNIASLLRISASPSQVSVRDETGIPKLIYNIFTFEGQVTAHIASYQICVCAYVSFYLLFFFFADISIMYLFIFASRFIYI